VLGIAHPYGDGVLRRIADGPAVVEIVRSAGLDGGGPVRHVHRAVGPEDRRAGGVIGEHAGDQVGDLGAENLLSFRLLVLVEHLPAPVGDLENRRGVKGAQAGGLSRFWYRRAQHLPTVRKDAERVGHIERLDGVAAERQ